MGTIEILTWLDYEGPEHTYICRDCPNELVDESTATHADEFNTKRGEHLDADTYVSLRCPDFPAGCTCWETSSPRLKKQAEQIWTNYPH